MRASNIVVLDDPQALYTHAAEEIAHFAGDAICTHGEFTFCLTGGSTPAAAYELLADRFKLSIDWKEVQFFWGDERCVPPDDEASNYGMANRTMLSRLALRTDQIHRILGEKDPEAGARAYETELSRFFGLNSGELPCFNLVLLGLGENSHVASLFPHHPAIHESSRLAVAVEVDAPQRHRVSLSFPVLNNAARVMFLVSGEQKAEAVRNVLKGPRDPDRFPAQAIAPADGDLIWLLDKSAARLLD